MSRIISSTQEQDILDDRERRFWAAMAHHARSLHATEPLAGEALARYQRVVASCDRASTLRRPRTP